MKNEVLSARNQSNDIINYQIVNLTKLTKSIYLSLFISLSSLSVLTIPLDLHAKWNTFWNQISGLLWEYSPFNTTQKPSKRKAIKYTYKDSLKNYSYWQTATALSHLVDMNEQFTIKCVDKYDKIKRYNVNFESWVPKIYETYRLKVWWVLKKFEWVAFWGFTPVLRQLLLLIELNKSKFSLTCKISKSIKKVLEENRPSLTKWDLNFHPNPEWRILSSSEKELLYSKVIARIIEKHKQWINIKFKFIKGAQCKLLSLTHFVNKWTLGSKIVLYTYKYRWNMESLLIDKGNSCPANQSKDEYNRYSRWEEDSPVQSLHLDQLSGTVIWSMKDENFYPVEYVNH